MGYAAQSSARRSLGFQPSVSSPSQQPTSHTVYSIRAGVQSPVGAKAPPHDTSCGAAQGGVASGNAAAAAAGTATADRYATLVREADAALQQLAACRRKAEQATSSASGQQYHVRPASAAARASASPVKAHVGGSLTGSPSRSTYTYTTTKAAATLGGRMAGSPGSVRAAAGGAYSPARTGRAFGGAGSLSGNLQWSPSRGVRPGSAGASGLVVPAVLKGELQALDSDIAAAEASLQAAAQRLGAAGAAGGSQQRWL